MPIAVISVVLGTMVLSVLSSLVLSGMVPYLDATSFPDGFEGRGLHWAAKIVRAGETITMPVVVLIAFLAQPRLNYALACDGLMPAIFAKVDGYGNLFVNTLITGTFFTLVAFVVPFITLWDIVNFGILTSFVISNASLLMIRTKEASPSLAPKLIAGIVSFGLLAAFFYQRGHVDNDSTVCLVLAIISVIGMAACMVAMYVKCPQAANDPTNFSAPLVPLLPTACILANFYLIAQIPDLGLGLGCAWVGVAILSYLAYGFKHAAARNGWNDLLRYQFEDGTNLASKPSLNEVRPSMSSILKTE
ncbi:hypothetical protein PybrP1_003976 [[Pythium] brassicae (nom. inval.)]|nr:hypothetical protein PybrP1_003976 [[Pythium] brassicae (nom. inval.)]